MKGVFILKKEILDYVPASTPYELEETDFYRMLVSRGKKILYSYECGEYTK